MWTHIPVPAFIFVWLGAKPRTPTVSISVLFSFILHHRRYVVADIVAEILGNPFADCIADDYHSGLLTSSFYPLLFDVDSGHEDHSGELPLFVGFVVD